MGGIILLNPALDIIVVVFDIVLLGAVRAWMALFVILTHSFLRWILGFVHVWPRWQPFLHGGLSILNIYLDISWVRHWCIIGLSYVPLCSLWFGLYDVVCWPSGVCTLHKFIHNESSVLWWICWCFWFCLLFVQYISLLFIGMLIVMSVRGFLTNLMKVNIFFFYLLGIIWFIMEFKS